MVQILLHSSAPFLLQCCSSPPTASRRMPGKVMLKNGFEQPALRKLVSQHVLSGFAASLIFLTQTNQAISVDIPRHENLCLLANAENAATLPFDNDSDGGGRLMMMRGMTAKNFDPVRYSGRWFEVASLKRGFAGQGQEDCHCTQGVYTFDMATPAIQVDTFCVHGSPDGYITGIRGRVQCLPEEDLQKSATELEKQEMIKEKCYLRFPTLPFIPKEPYDVIATDYDNFAIVSGAKDLSFVQAGEYNLQTIKMFETFLEYIGENYRKIYSRTPNPGRDFIEKYKSYLANFGYDPSKIKDTPQDCEVMSNRQLAAMMSMSGMQQALTNQFPDLGLKAPIELNPFTSVFDTFKKLLELYFK